ncbi:MAG: dTDP-4-dehydrorhamnose 3,5-epimerase [bacterium]
MEFIDTAIEEVKLLQPKRFGDARGHFAETFRRSWFETAKIRLDFCQDNYSYSAPKGTMRGLHFQFGPSVQAKLVRVLRGRVLDVAVDIRHGSPSFGQHVAVELSADNGTQILVPHGFAHGFLTLEPDCEVAYKVDAYYDGQREGGILWNDPALNINWPQFRDEVALSDKDAIAPLLADADKYFIYDRSQPFNVACPDLVAA